jgi:hypothetical protein
MDATPYFTGGGWTAIEIGPDLLTTVFISVAVLSRLGEWLPRGCSSSHLDKKHVWTSNAGPPLRRFFVNNPQLRLPAELRARARPSRSRGNVRARMLLNANANPLSPLVLA